MTRIALTLVVALLLGVTTASAAAPSTWSMTGHDPGNTAFNGSETRLSATSAGRLRVVWTAKGVVTTIATDTRVYAIVRTTTGGRGLVVMNAADGQVLFTYTPAMMALTRRPGDQPNALAHPGDLLIVGSTREVVALNPHTGRRIWYAAGGASGLAVAGSTIYTGKSCSTPCGAAATYALNVRNGRRIWQRVGFADVPVTALGLLFQRIGAYGGTTNVLDPRRGRVIGSLALNVRWMGDGSHAYAFGIGTFMPGTLTPARSWIAEIGSNGKTIWRDDLGLLRGGNPVLAYATLFAPSNRFNPGVIALEGRTGRYLWGANIGTTSSLVAANRLLYALTPGTASVSILRTANGALVRTVKLAGPRSSGGSLMVAGGTLYVLLGGTLTALRP